MTEKGIVLKGESALAIATATDRYNMMVEFVRTIMQEGKDYGKVPGSDKPTLLKPGAEKLNNLFGYVPMFQVIESRVEFTTPLFFYQYMCSLYKDGHSIGSGIGSCNSMESKYRYRWVGTDSKPIKGEAAVLKAKGIGRWRQVKDEWVWFERVENDQIYDLVNTIDKMAQKRALIAATLIACNASEFFTQDVEDLSFIEGEYSEQPVLTTTAAPTTQKKTNGSTTTTVDTNPIYQAVVDATFSENVHAAAKALDKCKTGYDTAEKAIAWMRLYRGWRDKGLESKPAADKANAGEVPN